MLPKTYLWYNQEVLLPVHPTSLPPIWEEGSSLKIEETFGLEETEIH